jgi:peptide deformylase
MAYREILTYQDPALRSQTEELTEVTLETRQLIADMAQTMEEAYGVGLAAPQVGILIRLFVYDAGDGPKAVINPRILRSSGEEIGNEGCLSIPRLQGDVPRASKITATWLDPHGRKVRKTLEGFPARVFQHEYDHLFGILFTDKAIPETLHMLDNSLRERDEVEEPENQRQGTGAAVA